MSRVRPLLIVIVLVLSVGSVPVLVSAQSDEWPDDRDRAVEVEPGTHSGAINTIDDTDYLAISVKRGDTVTVTLSKKQAEGVSASLDYPGGSMPLSDDQATEITRKVTTEENGFMYVQLSSSTAESSSESWTVDISRNRGEDSWNDNFGNASEVPPGNRSGAVNSPDDADYFKTPVNRGDTVTVTLSKKQAEGVSASLDFPGGSTTLFDDQATEITRKVTAEENGYVTVGIDSSTVEIEPESWSITMTRNRNEDSWNDNSGNASEVPPGNQSGAVNSPDDTDYFKTKVSKGDTVTVDLRKAKADDVSATLDFPGGSPTLFGEGLTEITRKVTAEENGYVTIGVDSSTVEIEPESWSVSMARNRGEDNWNDQEAEEVKAGNHSGAVNSPDDTDSLKMLVQEGDIVTVVLTKEKYESADAQIRFPGGTAGLTEEYQSTLVRRATVEENGVVDMTVSSSSVEIEPESWSIEIYEGNKSLSSVVPSTTTPAPEPEDTTTTTSTVVTTPTDTKTTTMTTTTTMTATTITSPVTYVSTTPATIVTDTETETEFGTVPTADDTTTESGTIGSIGGDTETATQDEGGSGVQGPGFGPVTALIAVSLAASGVLLRRRE